MVDYVVLGAWQDREWMQLAAARNKPPTPGALPDLTADDKFNNGPRPHPYGTLAHVVVVDGEPRVYPSKDHAIAAGDELKEPESAEEKESDASLHPR